MLNDFITQYGMEILYTIVMAVATYIGVTVKKIYQKHVNDNTKEKIVRTVVKAVEQMYKDLDGEEKLEKAIENITEMLREKGLSVTELEVKMLIEAAVTEMKFNFAPSVVEGEV